MAEVVQALCVFFGYAFIDACYAYYTIQVGAMRAGRAAATAAVIYTASALGTLSYTHAPWLVIPLALGSFVGTFVTVKVMAK